MQSKFWQGMIMVLAGAMLGAGCARDSEEGPGETKVELGPAAATRNQAVFAGDSIFHETMVDMTWCVTV